MSLRFDDVTVTLGGRRVLDRVSFATGDAEFIGVLGANGAGKTTLMRAALGLLPFEGRISVRGATPRAARRDVGYMPQTRLDAVGRLSGRSVIAAAFDGHRWGLPIAGRASRRAVGAALALVGASDLADRPLAQLSGGERQRLLLAEAVLGAPRLLLLDEPLISLDPHHQDEVVALVRRLQRALGITVLFSAHELNPLLPALDRILYLGAGRAALGTVDEVIRPEVLSPLYGAPIEVVRTGAHVFVMAGAHDMERAAHRHEHGHAH